MAKRGPVTGCTADIEYECEFVVKNINKVKITILGVNGFISLRWMLEVRG